MIYNQDLKAFEQNLVITKCLISSLETCEFPFRANLSGPYFTMIPDTSTYPVNTFAIGTFSSGTEIGLETTNYEIPEE